MENVAGYKEFVAKCLEHHAGPIKDARKFLQENSTSKSAVDFASLRQFGIDVGGNRQRFVVSAGPVFGNFGLRNVPSYKIRVTITLPRWPEPEEWTRQLRMEIASQLQVAASEVTFERDEDGVTPLRLVVHLPRKRS